MNRDDYRTVMICIIQAIISKDHYPLSGAACMIYLYNRVILESSFILYA